MGFQYANFTTYLIGSLGIFNGFLFGMLLVFQQLKKPKANFFLGLFIILISIRLFRSIHFYFFGIEQWASILGNIAFIGAGPAIYNFCKHSVSSKPKASYIDFVFLIPFLLCFFMNFHFVMYTSVINLCIYIFFSFVVLNRYKNGRAMHTRIHFNKAYIFCRRLLLLICLTAPVYVFNFKYKIIPCVYGTIAYSLLIYVFIFHWYRDRVQQKRKIKQFNKYNQSKLSSPKTKTLLEEIINKVSTEKLFLDHDLTLPNCASILGITQHDLSLLLNQELKKNYNDFINEFRINEVKKLLVNSQYSHISIEGMAYECGFNSPSAFYNAFKKHTGQTPAQFRKHHLQS